MRRSGSVLIASACLSGLPAGVLAQPATTQPATRETRPAVVYLVPEGQPVYASRSGYASSFYPQLPTTSVPADQVAELYSCVIRIDSDAQSPSPGFASVVSQDSQAAAALLTSTALMDPAAKEAIGLSPAQRQASVVVNVLPVGPQMARVEVILKRGAGSHYAVGDAAKLGAALIERLKAALAESHEASRAAALARRQPIEKELATAKAKIDDIHAKQRAVRAHDPRSGYSDPSMELNNVRNQKKSTESELARNRARLATLEPNTAPLIAQWNEIVTLRRKQLDDLKKAAPGQDPKASADAIRAAEDKLADAQAQLATARQATAPADGTNSNFRNNEIVNLHTTIADEENRLKDSNDQIARLQDPKYLALLDQLPEMQNEENRLRSQTFELQNRLDQIRRSTQDEGTVRVTVLDGQGAH
jgi:hypothetical protein